MVFWYGVLRVMLEGLISENHGFARVLDCSNGLYGLCRWGFGSPAKVLANMLSYPNPQLTVPEGRVPAALGRRFASRCIKINQASALWRCRCGASADPRVLDGKGLTS